MSIYKNAAGIDDAVAVGRFLDSFQRASVEMEAAAKNLHAVMQISPEARKEYDRTHKQMLRLRRAWNSIEHTREAAPASPPAGEVAP